jgi:ATP-dependent Clp protease adaptor protein ClpS
MGTLPQPHAQEANEPDDLPDELYELPDEEEPYELPDDSTEYELLLLNDDTHTFEYVVALLWKVFGLPWNEGFVLTLNIHNHGRCVVFKGTWDQVQRKRARVIAYGRDPIWPWSTGPLTVEIQPIE